MPRNLILNVVNFGISIVIGFWMTPYFIQNLGVAAYGLIPLALSLTSSVSILIMSFNESVARFLTIDIHQENLPKAQRAFNTAIFGSTTLILIFLPLILLLTLNVPLLFDIPEGESFDAIILFLGVFGAFLLDAWSGNFNVSMFVRNRLDIYNLLMIVQRVSQVLLVVALFVVFRPYLGYVGLSYLLSSLLAVGLVILAWKSLTPELKISLRDFDRGYLREIGEMAGWVITFHVGSLLFIQADLVIINILFGSIAAAEYAIALQWSLLLRTMATVAAGVLVPVYIIYYARKMFGELIHLSSASIKLLSLGIALPIGLLCGFGSELLTLWVGAEFAKLTPLLWILTLPLIANLAFLPLIDINTSFNRVRLPGIVTLVLGCGNILLAIALAVYAGWGVYGVALAGGIMFTLRNSVFLPLYAARLVQIPSRLFLSSVLPGLVSAGLLIGGILWLKPYLAILDWGSLIFYSGILTLGYLALVWIAGLNQMDRRLILDSIPFDLFRNRGAS